MLTISSYAINLSMRQACAFVRPSFRYKTMLQQNQCRLMSSNTTVSFTESIAKHLSTMKRQYDELSNKLSSPDLNPAELATLGKQYSELSALVTLADTRNELLRTIHDLQELEHSTTTNNNTSDNVSNNTSENEEMLELVRLELADYREQLKQVQRDLISMLTPGDADDGKNVVLEVRAGTGGDEASLFASELFRMYQRYALLRGWRWEEVSVQQSEVGGFREAHATISAPNNSSSSSDSMTLFQQLKFESGVHRVQRIPVNDTKIQTSAASVIVLPEVEELDIAINSKDLRIDVFRSSGAGGQSVNKTESAVRITHLPTNIVVSMQDERSQIQNRARAMKILRARVYAHEKSVKESSLAVKRSAANSTGDRSDKVRTYNFPQDRVTDHRVSASVIGVERVLSGEYLSDIIEKLVSNDRLQRLSAFIESLEAKNK